MFYTQPPPSIYTILQLSGQFTPVLRPYHLLNLDDHYTILLLTIPLNPGIILLSIYINLSTLEHQQIESYCAYPFVTQVYLTKHHAFKIQPCYTKYQKFFL